MALIDHAWYVNSVSYAAVTAWAATTAKVCGNLVRPTAPTVGNERVFVAIDSIGSTGGSEPSWVNTRGAQTIDSNVVWQEATGIAALNGDLTNTPNWNAVKNTAVTLGQVIQNVAGTLVLICTTAGTAGNGAEPSWAAYTTGGATTTDNTAIWTTLGASFSAWSAPFARLASCCTATWQQPGNTVFVGDNHAESQTTALTVSVQTDNSAPVTYILSVDHTAGVPPTNVKTGASVTIGGTSAVALNIANNSAGVNIATWVQGISFAGSNSTGASVELNNVNAGNCMIFRDCSFSSQGAGLTFGGNGIAPQQIELYNCTALLNPNQNNNNNLLIIEGGRFKYRGGSISATHNPIYMFTGNIDGNLDILLEAVDASGITPSTQFWKDPGSAGNVVVKDCKLANQVAISPVASYVASPLTSFLALIRSDPTASNTDYVLEHYEYQGSITTNTSTVRSGGATNGVTPISWEISPSSSASFITVSRLFSWLPQLPIAIWNAVIGTPITVTLYGAGTSLPTTAQLGYEVRYLGNSTSSLGSFSFASDPDPLASGSNWTVDSISSWSGSPANVFKLSTTFTPQKAGFLFIYLRVMAKGQTWYIDPLPVLT